MAKKPTDYYHAVEKNQSLQDEIIAEMSPEQIRAYHQHAERMATKAGYFSKSHKGEQKALAEAIHTGERLTNASLKKLIKNAKNQAGIDAHELLNFTLGNTARNRSLQQNSLSPAVLQYYISNIKTASQNFSGGISPKQVINQSRPIDIKRANEQIFMAVTFKREGNIIYFLTNAGPQNHVKSSKRVANHKVVVELLDYPMATLGKSSMPSHQEIKQLLEHGKIKFDCDCGRHRYWYRYIATVGKYNFGVAENRYPSTRNPQLTGVACKHVLRVMQTLMSGYGVQKVKGYMKDDIANIGGYYKSNRQSKQSVKKEALHQANPRVAKHWKKKIEKELETAFKQIKPLTTRQQYEALLSLQKVGIPLSKEQQSMLNRYKQSQAPFINKGKD